MEIHKIHCGDKLYPSLLARTSDSPKQLYIYGELPSGTHNFFSVVGTRRCTPYGEQMTRIIVAGLAAQSSVIVSGFAGGIDRMAHETAIEHGGYTIAVLAFGFDHLAGHHNRDLIPKILKNGCFVSEYEPHVSGLRRYFALRNRIIAGMAQATVVIEAPEKSGALITADYAKKYKRDLFAVPGDVTRQQSLGVFRLIQEHHAIPIKDANDIFRHMKIQPDLFGSETLSRQNLSLGKQKIIAALSKLNLTADQLQRESGMAVQELYRELSLLEMSGMVTSENEKYRLTAVTHSPHGRSRKAS